MPGYSLTRATASRYETVAQLETKSFQDDFTWDVNDGSHLAFDCYSDLIISWKLLANGGLLAVDDYLYNRETALLDSPFEGVNHFLKKHNKEMKILHKGYRVFLVKI